MNADGPPPSPGDEVPVHPRWARTRESEDFFLDEDLLRRRFHLLLAAGIVLLSGLGAGIWRLQRAALEPPLFVGIAGGLVFVGRPVGLKEVRPEDFERQLQDTVEVAFGRTEKGAPPELRDFCAPRVPADVARICRDPGPHVPADYVRTLEILQAKTVLDRPGYRQVRYRGRLSSRAAGADRADPVYLDCTFAIRPPAGSNTTGWRLLRVEAIDRDAFYQAERERRLRRDLGLPPNP